MSLPTAGRPSPTALDGVQTYSPLSDNWAGSNIRLRPVCRTTDDPSFVQCNSAAGSPTKTRKWVLQFGVTFYIIIVIQLCHRIIGLDGTDTSSYFLMFESERLTDGNTVCVMLNAHLPTGSRQLAISPTAN